MMAEKRSQVLKRPALPEKLILLYDRLVQLHLSLIQLLPNMNIQVKDSKSVGRQSLMEASWAAPQRMLFATLQLQGFQYLSTLEGGNIWVQAASMELSSKCKLLWTTPVLLQSPVLPSLCSTPSLYTYTVLPLQLLPAAWGEASEAPLPPKCC